MCSEQDPNGDICFFTETDWTQEFPWSQHNRRHSVSFVMPFLVPSLKNTAPILLEIDR